jgi:acetoin utilization protein AcuB
MTSEPVRVEPGAPVEEVRGRLTQGGFRHLPVVEDGRLIGIVSDRDVRSREGRTAADVMSTSVQAIDQDETVEAAARQMLSGGLARCPSSAASGWSASSRPRTACLRCSRRGWTDRRAPQVIVSAHDVQARSHLNVSAHRVQQRSATVG